MINPAYLLVIKDDDDIVFQNMEHYYNLGIRAFFVMFHCPNDSTINAVNRFINNHSSIEIYRKIDKDYTYKKDIHFNELSEWAFKLGYNWHIATDTDELLILRKHNTIQEFINDYEKYDSIEFKWFNYADFEAEPGCVFDTWKYHDIRYNSWNKAIAKWNSNLSWAAGQHFVIFSEHNKIVVPPHVAFYAHFPFRDKERFKRRLTDFAKTKFTRFGAHDSWPEWDKFCFHTEINSDPGFLDKRWNEMKSSYRELIFDPIHEINFNKACNLYRNHVGKAETQEERIKRINEFRCGNI
jgi:hypothetical protein